MCNLAGNDAIIVSDTLAKYNYQVEIASCCGWLAQMQYNHASRFSLLPARAAPSRSADDAMAKDEATGGRLPAE